MLRKPAKDDPLPAFDRDDDESASTGEFRPLVHDVRALPSFSADDLPRFPSMVDPRERESGPTITKKAEPLPRFASMVDPHELERERVPPSSRASAPARAPASARRVDALPRFPEPDVAATLEKRPMTANAANRILAQLDRAPPRLDATGEIEIEDVLEEVYAEPAPRSKRSDAPPSSRGSAAENAPRRAVASSQSSQSSRPAPMPGPSSVAARAPESVAPRPFVPAPPPSFTGTDFPQPTRQNPPSFAPPLPAAAVSQSSPPAYPSSPPPSFAPAGQPQYLAPQGSAPYAPPPQQPGLAYAATVPAGYMLVPQGSLMVPSSQAFAIGTTHDGSLVRPLPMAAVEEPRGSSLLGKVLAGGLILGLSALAGGAVSLWFVPEKAPDAPVPSVTVPSVAVPPSVLPTASAPVAPIAPSAAPPSASGVQPSPSVMVPLGNGWPLAPATVPPGAASMAPPPPAEKAVEPPPGSTGKLAEGMGRIVFAPNRMGHRVWMDGAMAGESTGPMVVKCGKRNIRIGSGANGQSVDVPCGGEVVVK